MNDDAIIPWVNALQTKDAVDEFKKVCGSSSWCESMIRRRPFVDAASIHHAADQVFLSLMPSDWQDAFSHHPKIGDIHSLKMRFAGNDKWSQDEQAAAASTDESTILELANENANYETKFGFIFIICASGKSANEVLSAVRERIRHDPEQEMKIAAQEQIKITHLRIDKWTQAP